MVAAVQAVAADGSVVGWRGGFGRLWTAAVLSKFGDALRAAALPLLAAGLTEEPLLVAAVTACGYLPWLVFGLLGGALADRVDQRRAMAWVDALRALLMAAFAVAVALGHASIGLLIALAFTLTTLQTLFDNAATALLPSLVGPRGLAGANARLMTGQQLAGGLVATPLVPLLLTFGAAAPYAADAVTYLVGAVLLATLRVPRPAAPPRPSGSTLREEIAEGLRTLWRDKALRFLCASTALSNIGMGALVATLVLHATGWLGTGEGGYAAAMTGYAAGSFAGGFLARRIGDRLGRIRAVLLAGTAQVLALVVAGTVRSLVALVAALAVLGLMGMVWNVNQVTLTQERTPRGALGRVSAAFRTVSIGVAPAGALLGGVIASAWGLNTPALLAAAVFAAAVLLLVPVARAAPAGPADTAPAGDG